MRIEVIDKRSAVVPPGVSARGLSGERSRRCDPKSPAARPRIEVIEGGHPNGTDLVVMGEHLSNPIARANAVPQRRIQVMDIGEGYALAGLSLTPVLSMDSDKEEPDFCIVITAVGGKNSELVPIIPTSFVVGEVGRMPLSKLRSLLKAAMCPKPEETA